MLKTLLLVGSGSFIGGVLRYLISKMLQLWAPSAFPLGTFVVNILGCLAIGLFYGLFERHHSVSTDLRLFLTVGFCGGFTTFSTFVNENFLLLRQGDFTLTAVYAALSLLTGLLMLYAGQTLIKLF